MAAKPLVIVGAGGFGRECLDIVEAINNNEPESYVVLGFLDDGEPDLLGRGGLRIIGPVDSLRDLDVSYVIGIGSSKARREIDRKADRPAATLLHPAATFGADVRIGAGSVITAGVRLTNHISLGRHVHLNLNATIGHDAILDDYVTVNPGVNISGNVQCGEAATLGTGVAVIQGCRIGKEAVVGAGAVVVQDIPSGVTAVGVPAKPIQR